MVTLLVRKTYGAIPGIAVGTWWETRYVRVLLCDGAYTEILCSKACSDDAVHA